MSKVALLIGVSDYKNGLLPLPSAVKDIEAFKRVLSDSEIGAFKTVGVLSNPDPSSIKIDFQAISSLTKDKNDLIFLFFSGHVVQDEQGKLYFATPNTTKPQSKERLKTSTFSFELINELLNQCQSRRQVIVFDCCFSAAFTDQGLGTDQAIVDLQAQLGGEGRAILTADISHEYSFEHKEDGLSIYTDYLIEGLETGMADGDRDEMIAVEEWHEYAQEKVKEIAPTVMPQIYAFKESYKILLAKVSRDNPKQLYRQEIERLISDGKIAPDNYIYLKKQQSLLGITPKDALIVEQATLRFYRNYQKKLQNYEETLSQVMAEHGSINAQSRLNLKQLQQILGLKSKDIEPIEKRLTNVKSKNVVDASVLPEKLTIPVPLNDNFIEFCKQELAGYVGPMANMMVKQALLGQSKSELSCQQLIEILSAKITNSQQAEALKRTLLLGLDKN
ncbi:MAG TPA: peptidase C14 [Cyanothece sp. UBA12306]|nr:peptidase C14 [Cyanothece sp. UBA12306]